MMSTISYERPSWAIVASVTAGLGVATYLTRYGWAYSQGILEYAKYNQGRQGGETTWDSVVDESKELMEAVRDCNLKEVILEGSDVVHAAVKHFVMEYLPGWLVRTPLPWLVVSLLAPVAAIKIAGRWRAYRCIRNHANPHNCDHVCSVGGYSS